MKLTKHLLTPGSTLADQSNVNPLSSTRPELPQPVLSVAYVASTFPLRSETFVYREVRALRERGHRVTCATLHASDSKPTHAEDLTDGLITAYDMSSFATRLITELRSAPVQVTRLLFQAVTDAVRPGEPTGIKERVQLPLQALVAVSVASGFRERSVGHIHAHFAHAPATLAMYAAAYLGISFSFTGHANDIFQRRALLSLKLDRAEFASAISEWHREFYVDQADGVVEKLPVIRCGVDTATWRPERSAHARSDELHIVTVCRLVDKKGIDVLIKALAGMTSSARVTIAGDGPERARLESLAQRVGCADQISWLGAIENDAVRELMATADVFALPCQTDQNGDRDGIPVVLMEAMASGVPVASGDLPAIRELIEHDVTGWLVEEGDTAAWSALFDRLSSTDLAPVIAAARTRIEEEFSLSITIDRLESRFGCQPSTLTRPGSVDEVAA